MREGIVVANFCNDHDMKYIYCIVYSFGRLLILPRWYYSPENLQRLRQQGKSKSYVTRLLEGIDIGQHIDFECDPTERYIVSYEKQLKTQQAQSAVSVESTTSSNLTSIFHTTVVISSEQPRRLVSQFFQPHELQINESCFQSFLSNVVFKCDLEFIVDLCGYKGSEPIGNCHPGYKLKFKQITEVDTDPDHINNLVHRAPWNAQERFTNRVHKYYPRMLLPTHINNRAISSECLILDGQELFCKHRPNEKCYIGTIIPHDVIYIEGRVIGCDLYYCVYNKAYVVGKYDPDPKSYGGWMERPWCTSLQISVENPMKYRVKDNSKEFLGYVKLNRFNHFFCNFCIQLIRDPKNLLHGRVAIGDANDMYHREKEHGVGIRCWLRYCPEKMPFKWEISEVHKEDRCKRKHVKFHSVGLRLNRAGAVYCPHVCNFPMHLKDDQELRSKVEVGDWFSFVGKFDMTKRCYIVRKVTEVIQRAKFEMLELANEDDVFAFRIPLDQNYVVSRTILLNMEIGFVEDMHQMAFGFIAGWKDAHPDYDDIPVWCRLNPDLENRLTPLCVIDIKTPEGKEKIGIEKPEGKENIGIEKPEGNEKIGIEKPEGNED